MLNARRNAYPDTPDGVRRVLDPELDAAADGNPAADGDADTPGWLVAAARLVMSTAGLPS